MLKGRDLIFEMKNGKISSQEQFFQRAKEEFVRVKSVINLAKKINIDTTREELELLKVEFE